MEIKPINPINRTYPTYVRYDPTSPKNMFRSHYRRWKESYELGIINLVYPKKVYIYIIKKKSSELMKRLSGKGKSIDMII